MKYCCLPSNVLCMCVAVQMATLGSQEGAFENVRMNYSGDQGQTIRQLITSHVLRRVGMCALTSPSSRRQHLAICSEKGKITILQLSALLRQAHSTKRKLTLTVCVLNAPICPVITANCIFAFLPVHYLCSALTDVE